VRVQLVRVRVAVCALRVSDVCVHITLHTHAQDPSTRNTTRSCNDNNIIINNEPHYW
jgi:hypothetical protein